jgi:HEAT repeat protein
MSVEELFAGLASPDPSDRACAAADLGDDDVAGALGPLLARLDVESDRAVRAALFTALARLSDPDVPARAAALLAHDDASVRNGAVALLQSRGAAALPALRAALASGDADVRKFALDALGPVESPEAAALYESALDDADLHVRMAAVEHLGERRVARLLPRLEAAFAAEGDPMMLSALYAALLAVGTAETWAVIRARHPSAASAPPHLRGAWAEARARWGGETPGGPPSVAP